VRCSATCTTGPAAEYVSLLKDRAPELLSKRKPTTYPATLTAVVTLTYDRLRASDSDAADLAAICAFLAPEPIPVDWFTTTDRLPASLSTRMADPLTRQDLLTTLARTSLAHLGDDGLTMHRLTQAVLRTCLPAPDDIRELAEVVVTTSRPDHRATPDTWPAWARLLPHLLALNPEHTSNPHLRNAAARATMYLIESGNAGDALEMAVRLHQHWHDPLGPDHLHTLWIASLLAYAHRTLGHYEQARRLDEDALARRRRLHGSDHPDTLTSANSLAIDLRELGDDHRARALNEDTLARRRRTLGDGHPDTLATANGLAINLRALGDYHAARALDEDILARRRRVLGEDHPDTLRSTENLAADLRALGESS
jgi:hypothetical protein